MKQDKQTLPDEKPRKLRKLARKNKLARLKVEMDKIIEVDDESNPSSKSSLHRKIPRELGNEGVKE